MRKYLIGAIALVVLALGCGCPRGAGKRQSAVLLQRHRDGGYNGTCTLTAGGAVLDNNDGDTNPNNNYVGRLRRQQQARGSADRRRREAGLQLHREPGRRRLAAAQHPDRREQGRDDRGVRVRRRGRLQRRCGDRRLIGDASCLVSYGATTYCELGGVRRGAADVSDRLRRAHVHHRRPARRLRAHERRAAAEARQVSASRFTVGAPPSGGASAGIFGGRCRLRAPGRG